MGNKYPRVVTIRRGFYPRARVFLPSLNCTPVIAKGVDCDIVSLERVSAIECVCHSQEGATEKLFYIYMCHFSQLHVRLPLDDFTMGVLVSSTWHLHSYIRTVRHTRRPFVFCVGHCIYVLALADWTHFHSPSSISRMVTLRLW